MSVAIDLIAGTVGGAAAVLIEHPFDTVKVLMQAGKYDGYLSCARGVFAQEGLTGFYRGMSARLAASGFEHAVVFASYKYSIRAVGGDEDRPTFWQACIGGCGSGVAAMLSLTPFELVKCKLQADDAGSAGTAVKTSSVPSSRGPLMAATAPPPPPVSAGGVKTDVVNDAHRLFSGSRPMGGGNVTSSGGGGGAAGTHTRQYSGSWDCARQIYKKRGVCGLYKGGVATLYREVPGTVAWCGTYDFLKRCMTPAGESPKALPTSKLMLAGGCAGVAFWVVMFPADVVKTRMQVDPTFDQLSFSQALRLQYRLRGWKGLYKGFSLTAARSFPSNAVIFMCFDVCSRTLLRHQGGSHAAAQPR